MAKRFLTPINVLNAASDPGTAAEGDLYYNTSTDKLKIYSNSSWVDVSSGGGSGVTSLTGTANEIDVSASTGAITISLPATINANTTGSAASLTTARAIALSGDVSGSANFDGSASAGITTTLANTAVTPASYGSASAVGTFTVDSKGRLTAASNTAIAIAQSAVTNLTTDLAAKARSYYQTAAPGSPSTGDIWVDSDETYTSINPNDYMPKSGGTFTGTVNLSTTNISGITTVSNYLNRTTASGNSAWLQQDGTGRVHWYWNTLGGTSPTFTNAGEDASSITQHVTLNGNGGSVFFRSANGVGASAGSPITWTTTLYVDLNTITFKGTPLALTSGATFTGSIIAPAATTSLAPIRIPHGTAPTAPTNGDVWTTTAGLFARINGTTEQYAKLASPTFTGTLSASTIDASNGILVEAFTKDDITTRTGGGFFQTATATTAEGWPETTNSWYHLISSTHSNTSNYYSLQLAAPFYSNALYFRSTNGVGTTSWKQVATVDQLGSGGLDPFFLGGM